MDSYEQKYKEALERARQCNVRKHYNELEDTPNNICEYIFPELAESEDERIRKALITFFNRFPYDSIEAAGTNAKEDIAWLEEQGEITKEWSEIKTNRIQTELQEMVDLKQKIEQGEQNSADKIESSAFRDKLLELFQRFRWNCKGQIPTNGDILEYVDTHIQELINIIQNPTDKVEPKFHEGDWVVNNTTFNLCHILKVEHGQYVCDDCSFPITKENEYHLWTIHDAKDGDVLTCYSDIKGKPIEQYGIIKEYVGRHGGCSNSFEAYIGVDWDGKIIIDGFMGSTNIFPATKEQRNLLEKSMANAGYRWDKEKLKLEKI